MTKTLGRKPILQEVEEASGLSREMYGGVMLDGMEARQRLVVSNLALVVSLASKYKRKNYDCSCLQVSYLRRLCSGDAEQTLRFRCCGSVSE